MIKARQLLPVVWLRRIPVTPIRPRDFVPATQPPSSHYARVEYDVEAYPTGDKIEHSGPALCRWDWWAYGCPTAKTRTVLIAGQKCAVVWIDAEQEQRNVA